MKGKFTRRESSFLRRQSSSSHLGKPNNRPKSMVTYEKGTPRDFGYSQKVDNREHGLSHDSWKKLEKGDGHSRRGTFLMVLNVRNLELTRRYTVLLDFLITKRKVKTKEPESMQLNVLFRLFPLLVILYRNTLTFFYFFN